MSRNKANNSERNLLKSSKGEILYVALNRIDKRNAINDSLLLALEKTFSNISDSIKCVILSGNGSHFSAGLDLSSHTDKSLVEGVYHSRMWHRVFEKIEFCSVPVIAVLHGAVVGGGLELASTCHIRVAEEDSFYALPEGQRGIYVGGGASVRVAKLIGTARMMDMILTGRVYNAQDGERIGFTQYLVSKGEGKKKAIELAIKICANNPITNFAVTHVLPRIQNMSPTEGLLTESLIAAISQDSPEAKKRLEEFLSGKAKKINE